MKQQHMRMTTSVLVALSAVAVLTAQPAEPDAGWHTFFGNLHAHTAVSDGVERPSEAFQFARVSAATTATSATFVGLAGQEFSVIEKGDHVNVYDIPLPIPKVMNSNYKGLFGQFLDDLQTNNPTRIVFAQFNHANSVEKDYGIVKATAFANYDGDWAKFVEEVDPWVSLIAVFSGPADSGFPKNAPPISGEHRDMDERLVRIWHTYLDKGMHWSPVADQDNHRKTWGSRTDGESDLSFVTDAQEAASPYVATLFHEIPGDGELPIAIEESDQLKNGEAWTVAREHLAGVHEAFLVRVRQVEAGTHVADAWSAPIWIDPTGAVPTDDAVPAGFVKSKNSNIYRLQTVRLRNRSKRMAISSRTRRSPVMARGCIRTARRAGHETLRPVNGLPKGGVMIAEMTDIAAESLNHPRSEFGVVGHTERGRVFGTVQVPSIKSSDELIDMTSETKRQTV
jgi:hypothetical protein